MGQLRDQMEADLVVGGYPQGDEILLIPLAGPLEHLVGAAPAGAGQPALLRPPILPLRALALP